MGCDGVLVDAGRWLDGGLHVELTWIPYTGHQVAGTGHWALGTW
jgi:hypothetical protein